jgi:hypothetical protein
MTSVISQNMTYFLWRGLEDAKLKGLTAPVLSPVHKALDQPGGRSCLWPSASSPQFSAYSLQLSAFRLNSRKLCIIGVELILAKCCRKTLKIMAMHFLGGVPHLNKPLWWNLFLTNQISANSDVILMPDWRQVLLYKCTEAAKEFAVNLSEIRKGGNVNFQF